MNTPRLIFSIIGILAAVFLVILLYFTIRDYRPDRINTLETNKKPALFSPDTIQLISWNIGYSGLSKDMSFFYDGGEKVRTSQQQTQKNQQAIRNHLVRQENIDFFLLQEVDKASKRSYYLNEYHDLKQSLPQYTSYFALNYKVPYVPVPLFKPLGKVKGGLASLAIQKPGKATRHQFPGNYPWPKNLFMLDRCFLCLEYPVNEEKKLYIINTHNSAYDDGGLKKMQMEYLKEFVTKAYAKGHYVIVGGDWNQFPPGIEQQNNLDPTINLEKTSHISHDFLPEDWTWAYDPHVPTNRSLDKPLNNNTEKAIIDYYLLSPNVELLEVKAQDLKFQHSDHQPVFLKATFK